MFTESAELYDEVYGFKDYAAEAGRVHEFITEQGGPAGGTLLDVACGTGKHMQHFRTWYAVEGVDLDENLLEVARRRHADLAFHHGDMRDFDLGRRFDVVTCLFSSIGYGRTEDGLRAAIANMVRHLRPGGALVIEPWLRPEVFRPGYVHLDVHQGETVKLARMSRSTLEDGLSVLNFHSLIGDATGVRTAYERHELGLFTREQITGAMERQGLRVWYDEEGLIGRGLYVGIAPRAG